MQDGESEKLYVLFKVIVSVLRSKYFFADLILKVVDAKAMFCGLLWDYRSCTDVMVASE